MKRTGFLIDKITDLNNLYEAFYKAQKTKHNNAEVISYKKNLYNNLITLQKEITLGSINIGNYKYFTIYEPKKRLICAAPFSERVLHHALMNVCHPFFENQQMETCLSRKSLQYTFPSAENGSSHFPTWR